MAHIQRNNTAFVGRGHADVRFQLVEWCPNKRSRSAPCLALCRILRRQVQHGQSYPHHIMLCLTFTSSAQTRHDQWHNVYNCYFAVRDKHTLHTLQNEAKRKVRTVSFSNNPKLTLYLTAVVLTPTASLLKALYFTLQCIYVFDIFLPINAKYFPKFRQLIVYHEYAVCLRSVRDWIFTSLTWDSYFQKFNNVLRIYAVAPNNFHCFKVVQSSKYLNCGKTSVTSTETSWNAASKMFSSMSCSLRIIP